MRIHAIKSYVIINGQAKSATIRVQQLLHSDGCAPGLSVHGDMIGGSTRFFLRSCNHIRVTVYNGILKGLVPFLTETHFLCHNCDCIPLRKRYVFLVISTYPCSRYNGDKPLDGQKLVLGWSYPPTNIKRGTEKRLFYRVRVISANSLGCILSKKGSLGAGELSWHFMPNIRSLCNTSLTLLTTWRPSFFWHFLQKGQV